MSPSVNWDLPIEAVPTDGGEPIAVSINKEYHRKPNYTPVKFPTNLWVKNNQGGTWYFTDDGRALAGVGMSGRYEGRFIIRNKP